MAATDVPVVLFVYNRPDTAQRVFETIRAARPAQLFVIADGGEPGCREDTERATAARAMTERVDWPCAVTRDYADVHLGVKRRIESGLDLVFAHAEQAIILEDDCVPDPTFFRFCAELLDRYRDDERVMAISGNRLTPKVSGAPHSYGFSRYTLIWGWATWRRAWRLYDGSMADWPRLRDGRWLDDVFDSRSASAYWSYILEANWKAADGGTWDYAWLFSAWMHQKLSVLPGVNMVTNIGFGAGATHNTDPRSRFAGAPSDPMAFPLRHPGPVARSATEDAALEEQVFSGHLDRMFSWLRARIDRTDTGRPL